MTSFRASQIAALAASGWAECQSLAEAVARARLPPVTARHLQQPFAQQWHAAETAGPRYGIGSAEPVSRCVMVVAWLIHRNH